MKYKGYVQQQVGKGLEVAEENIGMQINRHCFNMAQEILKIKNTNETEMT